MESGLLSIEQLSLLEEVIKGLTSEPKYLPSKLFYDKRGSELFDQICELEEYYPTRTEIKIMEDNINELAGLFDEETLLVEFGSGSSIKTRLLLDNITLLAAYVPIDISEEYLLSSVENLKARYSDFQILPLAADFTSPIQIPDVAGKIHRKIAYFPGSSIGNFTPDEAKRFLEIVAGEIGPNGGMIIGIDMVKENSVLESAYNDSRGITAQFNLNILERINTEFDADFDLSEFRHYSFFNENAGRIEMHLVSEKDQTITLSNREVRFTSNEHIITEYSYKYTLDSFMKLSKDSFVLKDFWTDDKKYFSLLYLSVK